MASQSPADPPPGAALNEETRPYYYGWAAMTRMMLEGYTWSGMERDCVFLNLGDGSFADVSAVSALDFIDDGRAVASVDWDGDGDLDLWLKNRSGPQLRFLRNESAVAQHWLGLRLTGASGNRDAVGARVEMHAGGRIQTRYVTAGDGYLSHSSRTLIFGLGQAQQVERVVVHWPTPRGRATPPQEVLIPAVDRTYTLRQGEQPVAVAPRAGVAVAAGAAVSNEPPRATRMVLREPLPVPPSLNAALRPEIEQGLRLVSLWAHWCAPCVEELRHLAQSKASLGGAGVDLVALNVDRPADREKGERIWSEQVAAGKEATLRNVFADEGLLETLDALVAHLRAKPGPWPLPMSFLIDGRGNIQVAYIGPVDEKTLLEDAKRYQSPPSMSQRAAYPGRWYYRIGRDHAELSRDLSSRGRAEDAQFYAGLTPPGR